MVEMGRELPLVVVVLAIHRPDQELLQRLLESLIGQSGVRVMICSVLDDLIGQHDVAARRKLETAGAEVILSDGRLGVREAFALGLRRALVTAERHKAMAIAYADQDDTWHGDKLARSLVRLKEFDAQLVHCDARVITRHGRVIAQSLHRLERREFGENLVDRLLLNDVTGMTAVFTPETGALALRLMDGLKSNVLHDHVTALAATALGRIGRYDMPLADYIQHDNNEIGAGGGRRKWWQLGWLLDAEAYNKHSSSVYQDRRYLLIQLVGQGIDIGHLTSMFHITGRTGSFRLLRLYGITVCQYVLRGQFRHAHLCLRCLMAAWRQSS